MNNREIDWTEAHQIACGAKVDEALRMFSEDATEDNAVALVRTVMGATRVLQEAQLEERTERATMRLLGKTCDPAPGVNWKCNRYWTVRRVRNLMREILRGDVLGTQEPGPSRLGGGTSLDEDVTGGRLHGASVDSGEVRAVLVSGSTAHGEQA